MDLGALTGIGLLIVRPGFLVATAPPFGGLYTPARVKVALSIILGITLVPFVQMPSALGTGALVVTMAREAAIGLALAMAVRILMAAAELAGYMAGYQLGFSYAATIDPQTGARNNVVASLYSSLTLLIFLAVDGHHALLRALARSYEVMPIGFGHVNESLPHTIAAMLGFVFVLGTQVSMPVVVVLLIVELAVGIVSRGAPALNLMVIGFPIRLIAGLAALAATIGVVPSVVNRMVMPALEMAVRLVQAFR